MTKAQLLYLVSLLLGGCASARSVTEARDQRFAEQSVTRFRRLDELVKPLLAGMGHPPCTEMRSIAEELCVIPEPICAEETRLCEGTRLLCDTAFRATRTFCTSIAQGFATCDSDGCVAPAVVGQLPAIEPSTVKVYLRACDAGDATACAFIGLLTRLGGTGAVDAGLSKRMYERACADGLAEGCYESGLASYWGFGVAPDPSRAVDLFRRACSIDAKTCYALGAACLDGRGVAQDRTEALRFFTKACAAGNDQACRLHDCAIAASPDTEGSRPVFACASTMQKR